MKKAKVKNQVPTVNVLRRGFDHYVPVEQICKFMKVEFDDLKKKKPNSIKTSYVDVVQSDGAIKDMESIHVESIQKYIDWLKNKHSIKSQIIAKFYIGVHKFHLDYESKLKVMVEESYS